VKESEQNAAWPISAFPLGDQERRNAFVGGTPIPTPTTLLEKGIYGLNGGDDRARPFILLRTQLLNALEQRKARILAVTSPGRSNGKSYVAANLATAICKVEDVCLVDLHLRRPVVADWFETPRAAGTSGTLTGKHPLRDAHFRLEDERLSVFPAGDTRDDTSGLLSSSMLGTLMSQLRALPGEPVCIIDCPPVLENDDMLLIARHVDGVLLLGEEGRSTKRDIVETVKLLGSTPIIGTLLNKSIVPSVFPD